MQPTNQDKKPLDLDDLMINIVKHFGYIRTSDLHKEIEKYYSSIEKEKKGKKKIRKKEEVSKLRFLRAVKRLQNLNEITTLKYKDLERFGIKEKDKRATYIILDKIAKSVPFYDKVFKLLKKGTEREQKNALIEIEDLMKDIVLTPKQLDEILDLMNEKNLDLCSNILRIINSSIYDKKIFPSDIERFKKKLINFYEKTLKEKTKGVGGGKPSTTLLNMKAIIVDLLGLLNDEIIIKWLKEDIQGDKDFERLAGEGYVSWTIAKLLDEHKEELFDFQNSLDEGWSKVVFSVRANAQALLSTHEMQYSKFKDKLKELDYLED